MWRNCPYAPRSYRGILVSTKEPGSDRRDGQLSAKLPHTFAHSAYANAQLRRIIPAVEFEGEPRPVISNPHNHPIPLFFDLHACAFRFRVPVHIRKRFLHHAKIRRFYFLEQPGKVRRGQGQRDLNIASLCQPFDIPVQCGPQPGLVKQRRMQKIRKIPRPSQEWCPPF